MYYIHDRSLLKQTINSSQLFRFVEVHTADGETFPCREAWSRGFMMSTCIGWDDLVTIHSAVVDQESDLVNVGDFLAYQSVSNEVIKLS